MVKHPGAPNSGMESLPWGPEGQGEGSLLMNLERVGPMGAGLPARALAFSGEHSHGQNHGAGMGSGNISV